MNEHFCCEYFESFITSFNWMQADDIFLMPYVNYKGLKVRVNNCPSCGKEVKNIRLKEDKLYSYFNN